MANLLKDTLSDLFGSEIEIELYISSRDDLGALSAYTEHFPRMVIATGIDSYHFVRKYFPEEIVELASLTLSEPKNLDELFRIPKGEKVLVVNQTKDTALETVQSLLEFGITHVEYVPYWENCKKDIGEINVAISPSMFHYSPRSISRTIDIGLRNFSLYTLVKILSTFSLDTKYLDRYVKRQKKIMVSLYNRLSTELINSNELKNTLQLMINKFDEAIISIDAAYNITELNSAAEAIIGIKKSEVIGRKITSVCPFATSENPLAELSQMNNIYVINERQVFINFHPLSDTANNIGILILREVRALQNREEHVRKLIYEKNYGYVAKHTFSEMVSEDEAMDELINQAKFLAQTDSTILITGESGTGKEILAQSIHCESGRSNSPFVAVNFAALPDSLIESELVASRKLRTFADGLPRRSQIASDTFSA